jgi:chromosome segregation ATPase
MKGEAGRHMRGHADQVATSKKKLQGKDAIIDRLNEANVQLNEKLDEASREIGTQKAHCDILNERNKLLEAQSDNQINHIKYLEQCVDGRNRDNNQLVQEIHKVKNEKLVQHEENALQNRRTIEKLGLLMKHVHDVKDVKKVRIIFYVLTFISKSFF